MAFIKLAANGVIIQKQPNPEPGFIEAPDDVITGMVRQPDGSYAPPASPSQTIEQRRAQVSAEIDLHAKALRDNVVQLISPAEMSSWPIKQAQALAFQAGGGDAVAPMLVAEAGYRQCTTAELVDMVLAKAQQLAALEAMISGECGRRQDLLRVADLAQIDALASSVRTGWPGFPDPPPISATDNP